MHPRLLDSSRTPLQRGSWLRSNDSERSTEWFTDLVVPQKPEMSTDEPADTVSSPVTSIRIASPWGFRQLRPSLRSVVVPTRPCAEWTELCLRASQSLSSMIRS